MLFYVTAILSLVYHAEAVYKEWKPTTNLGDLNNWDNKRLPCGVDKLLIREGASVVYLQTDLTIRELVLPENVEMVFAEGKSLTFNDNRANSASSCASSGQDVYFKPSGPKNWFNPNNWCFLDTLGAGCRRALDTDRVPCQGDDVIFPTQNTYYVGLDGAAAITVNGLTISDKAYTTQTFASFLESKTGRTMFQLPPSRSSFALTIQSNPPCADVTGCACGNDKPEMQKVICARRPECGRLLCERPVQPVGNCCPMCGSTLVLTYKSGFDIHKLTKRFAFIAYTKSISNHGLEEFIVSKRFDGKVQIVLIDHHAEGLGRELGRQFADILRADIEQGGVQYGVTTVELKVSGPESLPTNSSHTSGTSRLDVGQTAGLVIGLFLLVALLFVISLFLLKRSGRFENVHMPEVKLPSVHVPRLPHVTLPHINVPDIKLPSFISRLRRQTPDVGASVSFKDPENISATLSGFDNPMYATGSHHAAPGVKISPPSYDEPPEDPNKAFENPLFDSIQEMVFLESLNPEVSPSMIHMNPMFTDDLSTSDSPI